MPFQLTSFNPQDDDLNVDVLFAQALQNCFGYPEVVAVVVVVVLNHSKIIHRLLFNSMSYLFSILRAPYTQTNQLRHRSTSRSATRRL